MCDDRGGRSSLTELDDVLEVFVDDADGGRETFSVFFLENHPFFLFLSSSVSTMRSPVKSGSCQAITPSVARRGLYMKQHTSGSSKKPADTGNPSWSRISGINVR